MAGFSNAQVVGIGTVCFLALTYRNLDLKYQMNERIEELEKSLERSRRENKLLARELEKAKGKTLLSSVPGLLSAPFSWFSRGRKENKPAEGKASKPYAGTV
ncbi:hypothetical protein HOP50_03g20070 [Chloropicon primus]|uniref:Uncharacterized protein n=1 Tax=Chloropicon primus TaxID=1764295 RepID=A0A5B8MGM5_9CHLO|nr:hypothetical protein A3770_03p20090 [Chloropicon primus]UPQ98701.1 hypothetical protein HOP50_03g20070 [Chloropicon primus]|eukprot:QDZ19491.1 hypothetical protein A3770_03p20090 [Chloropicon primus]